jgi:hypothetical protein
MKNRPPIVGMEMAIGLSLLIKVSFSQGHSRVPLKVRAAAGYRDQEQDEGDRRRADAPAIDFPGLLSKIALRHCGWKKVGTDARAYCHHWAKQIEQDPPARLLSEHTGQQRPDQVAILPIIREEAIPREGNLTRPSIPVFLGTFHDVGQ